MTQQEPHTLLLTTGDVARLAGVSPECVRLWQRTGRLAASRTLSGKFLYTREAVEAAMRERAERIEARCGAPAPVERERQPAGCTA